MITLPTPPSSGFGSYKAPGRQKKSFPLYLVVVVFLVLILAAGYYFFFHKGISFFSETSAITPALPLTSLEVKVSQLQNFSFGVLDSPFYKSLKMYGALPITADLLGRTNPFVPY